MIYARAISLRIYTRELRDTMLPDAERDGSVLVYKYGSASYAVVFRFGVVVFWNVPLVKQGAFLKSIEKYVKSPFDSQITQEARLEMGKEDKIRYDYVSLEEISIGDVVSLSYPFAQSVVLERMEGEVDVQLYDLNRILRPIEKTGKLKMKRKRLMMQLGQVLRDRAHSFYEFGFEETPDDVWENDRIERLYKDLHEDLEVSSRIKLVNSKWDTATEEMQFVLSLITEREGLHIELLLVFFALFIDICLTTWEIFGGSLPH